MADFSVRMYGEDKLVDIDHGEEGVTIAIRQESTGNYLAEVTIPPEEWNQHFYELEEVPT